jgi:iodothyronine deiodinase-like protein
VEFLLVYIREAHPDSVLYVPTEDGGKKLEVIPQTSTTVERLKNLRQCASLLGLTMPALIDSDDNVVNRAYAAWPDRLYVVDLEGKIAYKGGPGPAGFRPAEVEAWLKQNVP